MNRREFVLTLAAAPILLREAPEALARRLGGTPLALVTADQESCVLAVDLASGRVLRRIRTLPDPRSIEGLGGGGAVVAHTAGGAVTLIDGPTLRIRAVLHDFDEPRYTAVRTTRYAYVTDSGRGEVVVVDVRSARVVGRVAVGGPARHLAVWGDRLWVSLGSSAERIAVLDVSRAVRPRLLRTFRPPFLAHDVGFEPDGRRVWVTSGDREEIAVYDRRSGRVALRLAGGAPPQHVTFVGGAAHVTSGDDGTLRVHALPGGRVLRTARVPLGSYNVQECGSRVLTPSLTQGTLCVLDRRGRLQTQARVASSSHDACYVFEA